MDDAISGDYTVGADSIGIENIDGVAINPGMLVPNIQINGIEVTPTEIIIDVGLF